MTLRAVKGSLCQKGYRRRQVTVVTTLLDPQRYPVQEILAAYSRRWRLELCLDDLKTTLPMESFHRRSPEMAQEELYTRLIAHNLIRCTMAQAQTKKKRQAFWAELLRTLAADLVPEHPHRRGPRAVKRKKNRYPRLKGPRHQFRDHLKRHDRRKLSRRRKLGLM